MSAIGKADLEISLINGNLVPTGDPRNLIVSSILRPTATVRIDLQEGKIRH